MSTIGGVSALATVVFVDVEGSTSLIDRVGDDAGTDAVGRQLDRVRERIETYGGREVKSLGDGLMLTFGSPRQAVGFALATQRALAASSPRVRIGINTGDVIDGSTDPIGAARSTPQRELRDAPGVARPWSPMSFVNSSGRCPRSDSAIEGTNI